MLAAEAPKITDWMQAWGSLAGLVMSTAAVIFTGLLFRHEIRVRRDEQRDSEAAQARLVVAQIAGLEMAGTDKETGYPVGTMVGVHWRVKNHSQAPIFDAVVSIDGWTEERWGEVIEGQASGVVQCDPPLALDYGSYDPREALVTVEFTDVAGLRWTRTLGDPPERVIFHPAKYRGLKRWLPFLRRKPSTFDPTPPF
ncbi:hypothetical protein [Micromonospora sp. NPDC049204]|uniref:hypothetical protein n=1 Tax=unclassified Micromonospora TaxID=2617518 RepID=UPI0033E71587